MDHTRALTTFLASVKVQALQASMSTNPAQDAVSFTLRLPDGTEICAHVEKEHVSAAMWAVHRVLHGQEETLPTPPQESVAAMPAQEMPERPEELAWMELPEEELPAHVKYAMIDQNLPEFLLPAQVVQIRDAILSGYTEADWARLQQKAQGESAPTTPEPPVDLAVASTHWGPPVPTRRARQQGVEWSEGTVARPSVPSRTVPKDSSGYPIVQRTARDVDPGEIAASVGDDGGVEQF